MAERDLEIRLALLEWRVRELEATRPAARRALPQLRPEPFSPLPAEPSPPACRDVAPAPQRRAAWRDAEPVAAAARAPRREAPQLEDLLGGRVLAWVGALAVLVGLLLLLAIAISNGWIGEGARTLMAGAASLGLLAIGARLHERRGRTEASLAAAAAGIAGLFATCTVAGAVYDLVPAPLALAAALATGAAATALALRWEAPGIAALGIVGALLAPALVGAMPTGTGVAMLAIATASATAVVVWQRWTWLSFAAFGIAAPQWLAWLLSEHPDPLAGVAALAAFGALAAAAAVGFELRQASPGLRISSALLLTLDALVLAAAGWAFLSEDVSQTAGHVWLGALAAILAAAGLGASRLRRVSHELGVTALALAVVLANVTFASVVDGLPLLAGWVAAGVGFAALFRHAARPWDAELAGAGLGGQLLLALGHALVLDAPTETLRAGDATPEAILALALVAAGCGVSARMAGEREELRTVLDGVGMTVLAYLTALAVEGPALAAAYAAQAVAFGAIARRAQDPVAAFGAVGFLVLAGGSAIGAHATPDALIDGLAEPGAAALALGAAIAAAGLLAGMAPLPARAILAGAAATGALYLASVELVTPFQPGLEGLAFGDLGVREQGQALLSALWALTGFGVIVAGLLRDRPELRRAALALLGVTIAKVFLYDLAALSSIYRVASFIVLGLLLLGGAFAWQRVRPRTTPDLRAMPDALR
jgi:uncharacterized membrane protein